MTRSKRGLILSAVLLGLAAASVVAVEGYHRYEMRRHHHIVAKLLREAPTVAQAEATINADLHRLATRLDAGEVSEIWTNPLNPRAEIREKVRAWDQTRIYFKGSMVYFLYFDAAGVMRDFTVASN